MYNFILIRVIIRLVPKCLLILGNVQKQNRTRLMAEGADTGGLEATCQCVTVLAR